MGLMKLDNRPFLVLLLLCCCAIQACSDNGCSTCVDHDVDPSDLIDPTTLGDGTGYPGATWTFAPTPASLGWSENLLSDASSFAGFMGSDAFMVVDRGIVVWQYGNVTKEFIVQSCRKSFLSALYGAFVESGDIDLSLTMEELGIDDLPPSLTQEEKQATIEMLLQSRSGVYHEAAAESQSMKDARPARGSHPPGTFWYYNNWDFNALGTIFTQLTGEDIFGAIENHFAIPLQMQEWDASDGFYHYEDMSKHPAYHFGMSARDMARFGLLFLREGRWRGDQIVPADWVERSTFLHSITGGTFDYGYMWWVGDPVTWGGNQIYAALGGSGQAIFVLPDMEVVITHKVDYDTWDSGWSGVYELVRRIMAAKVL